MKNGYTVAALYGTITGGAHHLAGDRVALDGGGEANAGGALAGGVHRARRDVRDVLYQLALGHTRVPCGTHSQSLSDDQQGFLFATLHTSSANRDSPFDPTSV